MLHAHFPIELQRIGYREKGTEYRYAPHRLENYQWYCVLYGTVDMLIDDENHVLNAEESILIPPGALRSPRSRERAPGYLWAHFGNRRLNLDAITRRVLPTPLELQQDLHALVTEVQQPADGNADDLIGALLVKILVGLQRSAASREPATDIHASLVNATYQKEIVGRVETFMRNNLSRPLTRRDLAAVVSLSPAHLARLFRQATNKTLNQRLTELRIDYSKKLLLESTLSITQISLHVGYRSFSHFSSMFKERVGISPSDYRQSGGRTWRKTFADAGD
ncbi:MAG: AraC family transcriptional regulator [Gemmatimonadetes bacterium]|jgi:AraC-like DNA-binding protein|nr:AraC family transcriptional regulator [Gemmatimonadota bacterium]